MTEIKGDLVPITEVCSPIVQVSIPFPDWVDSDRIGFNLKRVHRLCRIGGIRQLSIIGESGEETSSSIPMIVGMNEQGGAYAGKAKIKEVATHMDTFNSNTPEATPHAVIWANGSINLNLDEITQRIRGGERWNNNARSVDAWTHYLDKTVREGISSIGWNHLTHVNKEYFMSTYMKFLILSGVTNGASLAVTHQLLLDFSLTYSYLCIRFSHYRDCKGKSGPDGTRFSLSWDREYDRAILLKLLTKTQPVIEQIPEITTLD